MSPLPCPGFAHGTVQSKKCVTGLDLVISNMTHVVNDVGDRGHQPPPSPSRGYRMLTGRQCSIQQILIEHLRVSGLFSRTIPRNYFLKRYALSPVQPPAETFSQYPWMHVSSDLTMALPSQLFSLATSLEKFWLAYLKPNAF